MSGGAGLAYYNENDPFAAATLRELIADGHIAPGIVDERSIEDVRPDDLAGFRQCHFFAGGGIWSYALRRAGWPDDRPVWTCSCPCQPFSAAGKGNGFDDERHLWPAFYWLKSQCRPVVVLGEQVTGSDGDTWLDLVQADVEALDYAFGCVPLASAGFGAPNPRHRAFWLAHAAGMRRAGVGGQGQAGVAEHRRALGLADAGRLADERRSECGEAFRTARPNEGEAQQWERRRPDDRDSGATCGLADTLRAGWPERGSITGHGQTAGRSGASDGNPGPVNGFWHGADWLLCRDPKGPRWRPVDSGTFPLAPGHPGRVGTLRLSGNAINAEVATGFIEAVIAHLRTSEARAA